MIISQEALRMQKKAGIITEGQLREALDALNEDFLELKSIGRQLYSLLKKKGYAVQILENSSKSKLSGGGVASLAKSNKPGESDKGGNVEIHQLSDVEQIGIAIPTWAVVCNFVLNSKNQEYLKQLIEKKGKKYQEPNEKNWLEVATAAFAEGTQSLQNKDIINNPKIKEYIAGLGKELTDIIKEKKPNMQFAFDDKNGYYAMYFGEQRTKKGGIA